MRGIRSRGNRDGFRGGCCKGVYRPGRCGEVDWEAVARTERWRQIEKSASVEWPSSRKGRRPTPMRTHEESAAATSCAQGYLRFLYLAAVIFLPISPASRLLQQDTVDGISPIRAKSTRVVFRQMRPLRTANASSCHPSLPIVPTSACFLSRLAPFLPPPPSRIFYKCPSPHTIRSDLNKPPRTQEHSSFTCILAYLRITLP